mgnify:CR=1 FL=1
MPYIPAQQRNIVEAILGDEKLDFVPVNAGELNFIVSTFINNYIVANGLSYAVVNEMVGALECAKMELNRVIIGPYEDLKIRENGPVYGSNVEGATY